MELSVNGSEALPKDCQATYSRDRPSNTRVPPSSSSYMPRYRLTSIGAENLFPWSREMDTNVASTAPPTREFQETAKVSLGETATDGAEALETSGLESPEIMEQGHRQPGKPLVDRPQDRDFTCGTIRVDEVGEAVLTDRNAGPFNNAGGVTEAGAQVDGDGIAKGEAPVKRAPDFEVGRL